MNTDLRKAPKMNLKNAFSSSQIIQFLEKPSTMRENIEIFKVSEQKQEKTIWYLNQIITH